MSTATNRGDAERLLTSTRSGPLRVLLGASGSRPRRITSEPGCRVDASRRLLSPRRRQSSGRKDRSTARSAPRARRAQGGAEPPGAAERVGGLRPVPLRGGRGAASTASGRPVDGYGARAKPARAPSRDRIAAGCRSRSDPARSASSRWRRSPSSSARASTARRGRRAAAPPARAPGPSAIPACAMVAIQHAPARSAAASAASCAAARRARRGTAWPWHEGAQGR